MYVCLYVFIYVYMCVCVCCCCCLSIYFKHIINNYNYIMWI